MNENINKTTSTRIAEGLENWADLTEENVQGKNPQKFVFKSNWPGLKDANQHFCNNISLHFCLDFSTWGMTSEMKKQGLLRSICCGEKRCNSELFPQDWAGQSVLKGHIYRKSSKINLWFPLSWLGRMVLYDCYSRSSGFLLFSILCTLNCLTTDFSLFIYLFIKKHFQPFN